MGSWALPMRTGLRPRRLGEGSAKDLNALVLSRLALPSTPPSSPSFVNGLTAVAADVGKVGRPLAKT